MYSSVETDFLLSSTVNILCVLENIFFCWAVTKSSVIHTSPSCFPCYACIIPFWWTALYIHFSRSGYFNLFESIFSSHLWNCLFSLCRIDSPLCLGKSVSISSRESQRPCITFIPHSPAQSSVATSPGKSHQTHTDFTNTTQPFPSFSFLILHLLQSWRVLWWLSLF